MRKDTGDTRVGSFSEVIKVERKENYYLENRLTVKCFLL